MKKLMFVLVLTGCPAEKGPVTTANTAPTTFTVTSTASPVFTTTATTTAVAAPTGVATAQPSAVVTPCEKIEKRPGPAAGASIGSATMKADGTLVLQLRAEDPASGAVGQGFFSYAPDDPKYARTLAHIGGLKPCQETSVPPWPE